MELSLRPCPFCGSSEYRIKPLSASSAKHGNSRTIICATCLVSVSGYSLDEAIAAWNTRPIEDGLRAELARRDEVIARLTIECDAMAEENRVLSERIQRLVDWHVRVEEAGRLRKKARDWERGEEMSEFKLFDCVEGGAGTCRNEYLFERLNESISGYKKRLSTMADALENLRYAKCSDLEIAKENGALREALGKIGRMVYEASLDERNNLAVEIENIVDDALPILPEVK